MQPLEFPAPFSGINQQVPVVAIESPFCENLLNFNVEYQGLSLRKGDELFANLGNNNAYTHQQLANYGTTKLIECCYNATTNKIDFFNVETGAVMHSSAASGTAEFKSLYFNNYLFFFTDAAAYNPGFYYDGSTFGTIGYTGSGLSPFGGNVYKERAYIIERDEPAYWYTELLFITGALTKVDLSSIVAEKTELAMIARFTLSDQVSAVELQAFCMFNGEILFYSGKYPDSAEWSIVGRAKVGRIVNYHAGVQYQGDHLIFTDQGILSLRDLFLKGSEQARDLSVNSRINKTWSKAISLYREATGETREIPGIVGVWDVTNGRLIISMPLDIQYGTDGWAEDDGNTQFIFFTETQSWAIHRSYDSTQDIILDLAVYNGAVYYSRNGPTKIKVYLKEGNGFLGDDNYLGTARVPITFLITSAPISRSSAFLKKIEGVDMVVASDCYNEMAVSLPVNFKSLSSFPSIPTQKAQDTPTESVQVPFFNIGAIGNFIQWEISGSTDEDLEYGIELYGINIWTSQGGSPR